MSINTVPHIHQVMLGQNPTQIIVGFGTNAQGNTWWKFIDLHTGLTGYTYSNMNGTDYYSNADGSKYFNTNQGIELYTAPTGETSVLSTS
ncbi:hypothetical protein CYLTODRAFT_487940 [Cylindrobasidium torrendii FP15055 ss-10]|uniref:Uncharacterized protein n=1 Tax=Cylindrobasidium torrendii FP15055 ss-10 TaxID=1314674 RepID=A0A0D7BKA2_9AGAR|nr:hypothetical protein CYLTODRAFT_487940 [Cylindrobasidium torrendii FP15055 ss-10]